MVGRELLFEMMMTNADFQHFQAELALLKEQMTLQIEAHRLEVAAALERVSGTRGAAAVGDELAAMRVRTVEWERRELELGDKLSSKTAGYQAIVARAELDRCRHEQQIGDLEKRLALTNVENQKLHSVLTALMAEHAGCSQLAAKTLPEDEAQLQQLKQRLRTSELECAGLRQEMQGSLALKLARAIPWLLRPVRSLFAKPPQSPGVRT